MAQLKPNLAVYIGRFSLFHNGHAVVLLRALKKYKHVLVIVGSANTPRTIKNPWTAEERMKLIYTWYEGVLLSGAQVGSLSISFSRDYPYNNDLWLAETQKKINAWDRADLGVADTPIVITGSKRDDTSFYLDMFPSPTYELDLVDEDVNVSKHLTATWCREIFLGRSLDGSPLSEKAYVMLMSSLVPLSTRRFLYDFETKTEIYQNGMTAMEYLLNEYKITMARRKEIAGKYEPVSLTADSVVIQSGHVLLIRRRAAPGLGLWALPGGYVNSKEWTAEASIRELLEETSIKTAPAAIKGSIVADKWFEHPGRSNINRVITHAFCYKLPDYKVGGRTSLAKVKGTDDAEKAQWFPLAQALEMCDVMFDDHHAILEEFINNLPNKGQTS